MTWIKYDESLSALRYMYSIHIIEIVYANSLCLNKLYYNDGVFPSDAHFTNLFISHARLRRNMVDVWCKRIYSLS